MSWEDRIAQTASYQAPESRQRIDFLYEDVRYLLRKRTSSYDFPGVNGTFVQDLGNSGRRYPLRVIFSGSDYDLEAARFESMLLEKGIGRLLHPAYGTLDVVPFGEIIRLDSLKTAANEAIFEVTFFETSGILEAQGAEDTEGLMLQALADRKEASAIQFEELVDLGTVAESVNLENRILSFVKEAENRLAPIADGTAEAERTFRAVSSSITRGVDSLVGDPITLAFQVAQLVDAPARSASLLGDRLAAYADLIGDIVSGDRSVASPGLDSQNANGFFAADLFASGYVASSLLSVSNAEFSSRGEALGAAESILGLMESVTNWRDDNFRSLGVVDDGRAYQKLQDAVALASGFLVESSFSLRQERRIIIDRARTLVDLAFELYGSVDDVLDSLIQANNLSGSQILEIPRGTEIVYYL